MYSFDKIKLVIWDLDETFWNGVFSEGNIDLLSDNCALISKLLDIGIVNSICSKNDYDKIMRFLEKHKLLDYFVFPSINWEPKGARVSRIINDMHLRPENVLFIDDNPSNLAEALHFCPDLMVESPDILQTLMKDVSRVPISDPKHTRLERYRILEKKHKAKMSLGSNSEFLLKSNICVDFLDDCESNIDRIHELVLRSNQLNFTKVRSTKDELEQLLADRNVKCSCVFVKDNFGDYGLVGFFAIYQQTLIHFVFSCRILGMGVEQYTYNTIGRPKLNVIGEVVSDLSSRTIPNWINQNESKNNLKRKKAEVKKISPHTVLVKGPCDLFQIYPYIANTEMFDTDFTYINEKGLVIETTGHTTHIVESHRMSDEQKKLVLQEVPFSDDGMYNRDIFTNNYKVVFLSILADCNLGVYRRKGSGERFAFLEYIHPITDPANYSGLITKDYPTSNFAFSEQILKDFSEKYEFIGRNTPEQIVNNLEYIRNHLSNECVMVIMLGGELYYEKNTYEAYKDRHIVHRASNAAVREWAKKHKNVRLMDVNKYLVDQSSFYDHFNHYIKPVYYALAHEMVNIINDVTGSNLKETFRSKMLIIRAKEIVAPFYHKLKRIIKK